MYFANRLRFPILRRQRGQFGGSVYDEIVLALTTLASEKTGALIVIERNIGLRNFIDAGVQLDAGSATICSLRSSIRRRRCTTAR